MTRRKSTRRPRTSDIDAVDHWHLVIIPQLQLKAEQCESILTLLHGRKDKSSLSTAASMWMQQWKDLCLAIAGEPDAARREKYQQLLIEREVSMLDLLARVDAKWEREQRCQ